MSGRSGMVFAPHASAPSFDLFQQVERVTGRLTTGRVALGGVALAVSALARRTRARRLAAIGLILGIVCAVPPVWLWVWLLAG